MDRLRRILLELWIMLPLAAVIGFLGPFGTFGLGPFFARASYWWTMLMGAYVVVRPTLRLWNWTAKQTRLPAGTVAIWGVVLLAVPLATIGYWVGPQQVRANSGFGTFFPFAVLNALAILLLARMAHRVDRGLMGRDLADALQSGRWVADVLPPAAPPSVGPLSVRMGARPGRAGAEPRLHARLGPAFGGGDILALESEDHYVRVHGRHGSELLLMRLRDAITEMDAVPGEQVHRSWWIANDAIVDVQRAGRNVELILSDGARAPVARDSIDRLERAGFLPPR